MEPNNIVPNVPPAPPLSTNPPVSPVRKALATLIGIIIAVLAIGAYRALNQPPLVSDTLPTTNLPINATTSDPIATDSTADWLTYKNEQNGF